MTDAKATNDKHTDFIPRGGTSDRCHRDVGRLLCPRCRSYAFSTQNA